MFLSKFFSAFGRSVKALFGLIGKPIKDAAVKLAVGYVKEAARTFPDNTERRNWVLAKLMAAGLSENIARMLIEIAVAAIKANPQLTDADITNGNF